MPEHARSMFTTGLHTPDGSQLMMWNRLISKEEQCAANLLLNTLNRYPYAPRESLRSNVSLSYLSSDGGGSGGWESGAPRPNSTMLMSHRLMTAEPLNSWGLDSLGRSGSLPSLRSVAALHPRSPSTSDYAGTAGEERVTGGSRASSREMLRASPLPSRSVSVGAVGIRASTAAVALHPSTGRPPRRHPDPPASARRLNRSERSRLA